MAASLATIEIEGGMRSLKCPVSGVTVFDREEGFDPTAEHSPYLRFFVDWIGEVWVANPSDLDADQARYQRDIVAIFANSSDEDDQNTLIAKCIQVLPKSAIILEVLDPPIGSSGGDICYACFDLGGSASTPSVRLQQLE